jgi:hypothetical protein
MFAQVFSRAARSAACAHARNAFASTSRRDAVRSFGQLADPATFELLQGPEGRVIVEKYVRVRRVLTTSIVAHHSDMSVTDVRMF